LNTRILLVEDDFYLSDIMQRALRRFNYTVVLAENGQEAIEAAISDPPDLILMDLMLPVLDGFEAAHRIRKNPRTTGIPIIGITAQFDPENRNKCLAAGFDDLILKPFPLRDLKAIIEKVLKSPST
jgi:CheY-like chemotaxis protein